MNAIAFPLNRDSRGPEVVDLQEALLLILARGAVFGEDEGAREELGSAVRHEADEHVYGDATARVVSVFQEERQLGVEEHGAVDRTTAAALNALLGEWGVLDRESEERAFAVSGTVRGEDGAAFAGGHVRAYHEGERGPIRLGEDFVDREGSYVIRYQALPETPSIRLRVSVSDPAGSDTHASAIIEGAGALETVGLIVPSREQQVSYSVEGTVASQDRAGVGGLGVLIVDINVGEDFHLGETITDERGRYQIQFTAPHLHQRNKTRPDLQARVVLGDQSLAASDVRYDARLSERLDVQLPAGSAGLTSAHATLIGALSSRFTGNLRELQETRDRHDITYLANKTGWDARTVAMAALADQFSQHRAGVDDEPGIAAPFYYALFRAGLPANQETLYALETGTVESIWHRAIDQGVIPAEMADELPRATETFQRLGAARALDVRVLEGASTLKELLAPVLTTDDQQRQFAELRVRHRADLPAFWDAVEQTFGADTTKRLRLDGQLRFMTLNNAPLIAKLHAAKEQAPLGSSLDLARRGYYKADKWRDLGIDTVPDVIPGDDPDAKRAHYHELLAAQVRIGYPTAVMAEMVGGEELPLNVTAEVRSGVHGFLAEHQAGFVFGMQPVEQYLVRNGLADQVDGEVTAQVKRLQRVYQITPDDQAMQTLLAHDLDSAHAVVRYQESEFVQAFKDELGGEEVARLTYAKADQVNSAVLNIATSYITMQNGPAIGGDADALVISGGSTTMAAANASDVIAMPTLEGLLGSMDYCDCEHCRSILSPAAYLVDLLMFIDRPPEATAGKKNPLTALLDRRPDLEHLPLTCENTNTRMPYIDVVNETLEYYVANTTQPLSLTGYKGHDTGDTASADELLANPQFVNTSAYETLAKQLFPPPLPFHQPLEALRRSFEAFEAPLPAVLEAIRVDDSLDRANDAAYGWHDILMERVKLSRTEHRLLTDSSLPLAELYGFEAGTTDAQARAQLGNVKAFCRRMGITYEQAVTLLRTAFINPASALIPRLERLHVPFATLKDLKDGTITDAEFDALVPDDVDPAAYGGDISAWVKDPANYARIIGLITLADPSVQDDPCSFDTIEFRYTNPDTAANGLRTIDYVRLLRFIHLWKKLGWTIGQTDEAIAALYPTAQRPTGTDEAQDLQKLDNGFRSLVDRLGVLLQVMDRLDLNVRSDLQGLLACWSDIGTHGHESLYRRMFLSSPTLRQDVVFADDGYGRFLQGATPRVLAHGETLRAAFSLTGDEFARIAGDLGYTAGTQLTLEAISAIHRRGWLARKLRISVRELLLLIKVTGIDPFAAPDPPDPPMLRFIALLEALRATPLKPVEALYLFWNHDLSGRSVPEERDILAFVRTLRTALHAIDAELAVVDDPTGEIARARMALVYGVETTDVFFGLLNDSFATHVPYDHDESDLDAAIVAAGAGRLEYDDFRKHLTFSGAMSTGLRDAIKTAAGSNAPLTTAIDALFTATQQAIAPLFMRYPDLKPLYDVYAASTAPLETRRRALLDSILPALRQGRQRQQVLETITATAGSESTLAPALLHDRLALHATRVPAGP